MVKLTEEQEKWLGDFHRDQVDEGTSVYQKGDWAGAWRELAKALEADTTQEDEQTTQAGGSGEGALSSGP